MAEALALDAGLLVSPGDLYGPDGAGFVRVAVVQPMDRLRLVADRLSRLGRLLGPLTAVQCRRTLPHLVVPAGAGGSQG